MTDYESATVSRATTHEPFAACTVVAKNYLAYARVLADSFLRQHPGWRFIVLLADRVDGYFELRTESFELIPLEDLKLPNLKAFCFQYTTVELSTAVKPYLCAHLFARFGLQKLIFLDPDILVFKPLTQAIEALDHHAIVLTPHLTQPLDDDGRRPTERTILRAGAYNLGFFGLSRSSTTTALLSWWQERLRTQCEMAPGEGLHVDQKWVDLVPGLFGDVGLIRDPGYNVAYWNLPHRPITITDGEVSAAGIPCTFFHFSGFDPEKPHDISKYQDRMSWEQLGDAKELFERYRELLMTNGYRETVAWPSAFGAFDNGAQIPDAARTLYLHLGTSAMRFGDPFVTTGPDPYFAWLNTAVDQRRHQPRITRLWHQVYTQQSYLQRAFPDVNGMHRESFLRWIREFGRFEYAVDERLVPAGSVSNGTAHITKPQLAQWFARFVLPHEPWLKPMMKRLVRSDPVVWHRLRMARYRLSHHAVAHRSARLNGHAIEPRPFGVNVLGYVASEKGMGESVRASIRALHATDVPHVANPIQDPTALNRDAYPVSDIHPYCVNLLHINADQVPAAAYTVGEDYLRGRYNIGYWTWELPEFPNQWRSSFEYFDEIWVPSRFVLDAISRVSPVPVVRMPHTIDVERLSAVRGLSTTPHQPGQRTTFLFLFDFMSYWQRKNPFGLIDAFTHAFGQRGDVELIIKTMHASIAPGVFQQLQDASRGARIILTDGVWSRDEVVQLLARCDCFVSLHRSEGFGLCLAEAMALGKPVIATAYSGNLDFMDATNSLLVNYRLVELPEDYGPYPRGSQWAEPDLEHAVRHLQWVASHPEEGRVIGERAACAVRETLSPQSIGTRIHERLLTVVPGLGVEKRVSAEQLTTSSQPSIVS